MLAYGPNRALAADVRQDGKASSEFDPRSLTARLGYPQINYPVLSTFLLPAPLYVATGIAWALSRPTTRLHRRWGKLS